MAEFNLPLWKIYELAADAALKEWGDCRILAGLDCYTDDQINAYQNKSETEIKTYKEAAESWNKLETELRTKSKELYWKWRKEINRHDQKRTKEIL